jgi:oxygen-independent coproporphyrinogen-3 oxidase
VTNISLIPEWLGAVRDEISWYTHQFGLFDTVYLGGGTPSLLDDASLAALFDTLASAFPLAGDAEVTIEVNPEDVTPQRLAHYRRLGINRISLGVQSFCDRELRFLGRRHTASQSERALETIRNGAFTTTSVDLMYGLPSQTPTDWKQSLLHTLDFQPEHLSCYELTVEPQTRLEQMVTNDGLLLPDEARQRELFLATSELLEDHGYLQYEVSNFATAPEHHSRHNQKYWHHTPYLGLGPGAHSYQGGRRWWNVASLEAYCATCARGQPPVEATEILSADQYRLESLYLGLRTQQGVDLVLLQSYPGWRAILATLQHSGLVRIVAGRLVPTREGLLVADGLPLLFCD